MKYVMFLLLEQVSLSFLFFLFFPFFPSFRPSLFSLPFSSFFSSLLPLSLFYSSLSLLSLCSCYLSQDLLVQLFHIFSKKLILKFSFLLFLLFFLFFLFFFSSFYFFFDLISPSSSPLLFFSHFVLTVESEHGGQMQFPKKKILW